uniref:Uncharacterized protein n=1 Tax=Anguilla anguilla TaxID=7936 RepID=A0A0E9T8P8_ANGAN
MPYGLVDGSHQWLNTYPIYV